MRASSGGSILRRRLYLRCAAPRLARAVLAAICLGVSSASPLIPTAQAQAQAELPAPRPQGVRVVEVKGKILPALRAKMREVLEGVDQNRFPAGALILLDSPGGDGLVAFDIGRMVREAGAHVFVRGRCASACVFILAGGVVRGAALDQSVAIHRPRLTTFVKGLGVVDINAASNPKAAEALAFGNRRSREFLQEMGMPDGLYAAMMAAPTDQMRRLDLAELPELGLFGIDPAYRAVRAPAGAARYRISEDEFVRRTLRVPERCLADEATPREIVVCYRRVLQTGN